MIDNWFAPSVRFELFIFYEVLAQINANAVEEAPIALFALLALPPMLRIK
jgi:hypothetical protein